MTAPTIELAPQQQEAAVKVTDWYRDQSRQVFRLFGYAGTGKTTLAQHLVDQLGVSNVLYAAYTGKAAYVLRTKGCDAARTIHSLIYLPAEKAREKLRELLHRRDEEQNPVEQAMLDKQIRTEEARLETPSWILRAPDETDLAGASLLVVDEVSMVGEGMAVDLLSFGVPTLVLGDPAQLPPVDGGGYFIDATPDHLLTEIHRSALDSPVTRLATTVRALEPDDSYSYGVVGMIGNSGRTDRITVADLLGFDQVLVGTNKLRWQAIHLLRALRGHRDLEPVHGDRIMVLANNPDFDVFNGQQFTVKETKAHLVKEDRIRLRVEDDDGHTRVLTAWRSGFTGLQGEREAKREGRGQVVAATFGQAITVHKAQGSQWDRVLVVDEAAVFAHIAQKEKTRTRQGAGLSDHGEARLAGHLAGQRWLYTAITRAVQQVVIVPRIRGLLG